MRWLALTLAGPLIWAVTFTLVYALHGVLCAGVTGPEGLGAAARTGLIIAWGVGLVAFVPLFRAVGQGRGRSDRLARYGAWIGLVATIYTLFPVTFVTSC